MLDIIVVGGGIAGFAATAALRRAGHRVNVYERSGGNTEVGAAIKVPPNISRPLGRMGLDPAARRFSINYTVDYVDFKTKAALGRYSYLEHKDTNGGGPVWNAHRVDLWTALRDMATDPAGPGMPPEVHFRSPVVGFNSETPSITLAGGREMAADLIVAADGVHSAARAVVLGHEALVTVPTEVNSCYRFLIPREALEADPATRFFNEDAEGNTRIIADHATKRVLVSYLCRDNTVQNFVALFYDDAVKDSAREDWHAGVDKSHVLEEFKGFHPDFLAVIGKATEVLRFPLLYRAPVDTFHKGRLVLAGDAAHPMLPHHGQGGAMGVEDGLALGVVLHGAVTPEDIERRLDVYEAIRRKRASAVQVLSSVGIAECAEVRDKLMPILDEEEIPSTLAETINFESGHDVIEAAVAAMKQLDPSFELPKDFQVADEPVTGNGAS